MPLPTRGNDKRKHGVRRLRGAAVKCQLSHDEWKTEDPSVHKQPYQQIEEERTKRGTSRAKSPSGLTSTSVTNSHLCLALTASAANCHVSIHI